MVLPNSDTAIFCTWLQDSGYYRFSPSRLANIAIIKNASETASNVTNQQYNDFIRFTGHLYPAFLEYIAFNGLSQYSIKIYRQMFAYYNQDLTHTGDTFETVLHTISIPANSMNINSKMEIFATLRKVGVSGTNQFKVYVNTTANLNGSPKMIGTFTLSSTTIATGFRRQVVCKNSQSTQYVYNNASTGNTDFLNTTGQRVALNADFSQQQYLVFTVKLSNISETGGIDDIQVYIDET